MTPRKPPTITGSMANTTINFPPTSPRRNESSQISSLSDLLTRDTNPIRNSDSLLMNKAHVTPNKKPKIPPLTLDTVFAMENEDQGDS